MIFRALLALFISLNFLNCASLLTYNFYSKDDYFDIILSFNEAYSGQIRQQNSNGKTILFLENVDLKEDFTQNYNLGFVKSISFLSTDDNSIQIEIYSASPLTITASKSPDKFGMRIKASKKMVENFSELGAQKDTKIDNNYISVIVVLAVLVLVLFFIKRKIQKKKAVLKQSAQKNGVLKNSTDLKNSKNSNNLENSKNSTDDEADNFAKIAENFGIKTQKENVKIIFEKGLDEQNKVILLEHNERRYLVLVGSSNVVLDRFGEDGIHTLNDFENFFLRNKDKLTNYISTHQNSLENYKNRLSQDN